ncbi:MAG: SAM-dependent DNA methyltransferase [Chloroflexia bacterium]|nr:SAM-dependent DNA methyltransferase [Chloroflexia bacterium]
MDAAEYKHVVLGLIFLKYISDAFDERYAELEAEADQGADPEDKDEYVAEGLFWVPPDARWNVLKDNAHQPTIGTLVDGAMESLERENPSLRDVLPKQYARPTLNKQQLGQLIDNFSNLKVGGQNSQGRDVLGQVYEYFLAQFASAEGKQGGEFYTPASVVKVLVGMLAPYKGRVYDPCCGSGGMFVQSERFVEEHKGRIGDISIFGQESNPTTWKLAKMNLAIRGIEANLGRHNADTFHHDLHPDLRADYILANPPFNISNWGGDRLRSDQRWDYGVPPTGNANFAWVQHFIHHLAPNGVAGFVLANGSLSTNTSGEGAIRQNIIEADLVDCIVSMPGQLFFSTQIPVSLWFLAKNRKNGFGQEGRPLRDRSGEILFIDARQIGELEDRTHRVLSDDDMAKITGTYHAWRGDGGEYEDVPGFCKTASLDEVRAHGHVLTPGRYVGTAAMQDDGEPFAEKMDRLTERLTLQFDESARLESIILEHLAKLRTTTNGREHE